MTDAVINLALPSELDLQLVGRNPARLPEATVRAALELPIGGTVGGGSGPLVSIVVVTCNKLAFTRMCLRSVAMNTGGNFEILVVDNGSNDGTLEFLRAFSQKNGQNSAVRVL